MKIWYTNQYTGLFNKSFPNFVEDNIKIVLKWGVRM
jgi:hypothetical protein